MSDTVLCRNIKGEFVSMPKSKLSFRPSAYALVLDADRLLMQYLVRMDMLFLPGGGLEIGETREDAIRREGGEETGLRIEPVREFRCVEGFTYYDPLDLASHNFAHFYVSRLDGPPGPLNEGDPEEGPPLWVHTKEILAGELKIHPVVELIVRDFLREMGFR